MIKKIARQLFDLNSPTMAVLFVACLTAAPAYASATEGSTPSNPVHLATAAYRTDTVVIPLESEEEIEWMARATTGAVFVYSWTVEGLASGADLLSDFHGHTETPAPERVDMYHQISALQDHGGLTVPFDGAHGWYFKNDSDAPITVHLKVAGFYTPVDAE